MDFSANRSPRPPYWVVLAFLATCFTIPFLIFRVLPLTASIDRSIHPSPSKFLLAEDPEPGPSEFYEWDTHTFFNPVRIDGSSDKPTQQLCAAFPARLLDRVQPILKTGQAMLDERLSPHLQSVSACLGDLPIFSDMESYYQGHRIIDVIADIPDALPSIDPDNKKHKDQLRAYKALQQFKANGTLASADLSVLQGWKTDKFKFLSGVSRAWHMRPNKDWYVFFEDDTYIFWDNLFRFLAKLDPNRPLYIGDPSPGRKPTPDLPKMWFANGGPGYILSRAAMRRLIKDDWDAETGEYLGSKLTERWWYPETLHNCCGDSILGWVLWEAGIPITGLWPMFSAHPAHKLPLSDKFWCKPMLTMHRTVGNETVRLWHWEQENRLADRPLLFRDLALSFLDLSSLTTRDDWDNEGRGSYRAPSQHEHYTHDPHVSFEACRQACEAVPDCMQYSYRLRRCKMNANIVTGSERQPELGKVPDDLSRAEKKLEWRTEDLQFRSGWVQFRVQDWMDQRPCPTAEWVRPSVDRVD